MRKDDVIFETTADETGESRLSALIGSALAGYQNKHPTTSLLDDNISLKWTLL